MSSHPSHVLIEFYSAVYLTLEIESSPRPEASVMNPTEDRTEQSEKKE